MIHVIIYCDSLCFVFLGMDKIYIQASASSPFLRLTFQDYDFYTQMNFSDIKVNFLILFFDQPLFYNFRELFSGSGNHLQRPSTRSGKF